MRRPHPSTVLFGLVFAVLVASYFAYLKSGPQAARAFSQPGTSGVIGELPVDRPVDMASLQKRLTSIRRSTERLAATAVNAQVPLDELKADPFDAHPADAPEHLSHAAAVRAVRGLHLQSVLVTNQNRSCTINDGLFLEGQRLEGFTVERITAGSVIVRSGPYRFELLVRP
jgi:hypothetical protein